MVSACRSPRRAPAHAMGSTATRSRRRMPRSPRAHASTWHCPQRAEQLAGSGPGSSMSTASASRTTSSSSVATRSSPRSPRPASGRAFGVDVPLREGAVQRRAWRSSPRASTLRQAGPPEAEAPGSVPVSRTEELPLSFAQRRLPGSWTSWSRARRSTTSPRPSGWRGGRRPALGAASRPGPAAWSLRGDLPRQRGWKPETGHRADARATHARGPLRAVARAARAEALSCRSRRPSVRSFSAGRCARAAAPWTSGCMCCCSRCTIVGRLVHGRVGAQAAELCGSEGGTSRVPAGAAVHGPRGLAAAVAGSG